MQALINNISTATATAINNADIHVEWGTLDSSEETVSMLRDLQDANVTSYYDSVTCEHVNVADAIATYAK